ncbi:MAG: bL17 family ribosomal protein, partial [Sphaerochaetaceae bacterium]|nr:bL17 family ribosomal protein [Sphaerochaetaceae bacterium]
MKHRIGFNALSRRSGQRKALKRGLVTSLFKYERIETTKAKAKEVQRMAEKMVTRAKHDSVHSRRIV